MILFTNCRLMEFLTRFSVVSLHVSVTNNYCDSEWKAFASLSNWYWFHGATFLVLLFACYTLSILLMISVMWLSMLIAPLATLNFIGLWFVATTCIGLWVGKSSLRLGFAKIKVIFPRACRIYFSPCTALIMSWVPIYLRLTKELMLYLLFFLITMKQILVNNKLLLWESIISMLFGVLLLGDGQYWSTKIAELFLTDLETRKLQIKVIWEIFQLTHFMPLGFFIPPENIRKPLVFWCFQGV